MDPLGCRINWTPGQRVSRRDSVELGVVVSVDQHAVKVKWDRGRTSYYRPDRPANVMLAERAEKWSNVVCPADGA
jgi:hypothetical protein